jgi:hypothetical protein
MTERRATGAIEGEEGLLDDGHPRCESGRLGPGCGPRQPLFPPGQLDRDRLVADRDGLELSTVEGDMADLSAFPDGQLFHVSQTMEGRLGLLTETGSAVTARKTVGRTGTAIRSAAFCPAASSSAPNDADQRTRRPCRLAGERRLVGPSARTLLRSGRYGPRPGCCSQRSRW